MKNKIKVLGIIALAAIIGFGFLACEDAGDDIESVKIEGASIGWIVNETLTIKVVPEGKYAYQWYKDGKTLNGEDKATYTPTAAGEYYATAGDNQFESNKVKVIAIPIGNWKMTGTDNQNWKPNTGANTSVSDESVVISKDLFDLTSTWDTEFLKFTIYRWDEVTFTEAGITGASDATKTAYPNGYKLTIGNASQKPLTGADAYYDAASPTKAFIFTNAAGDRFIRVNPDKTGFAGNAATGTAAGPRFYAKVAAAQ